jgi:hypothetical protein
MTSTLRQWLNGVRKRTTVEDAKMGPRQPHSTVLTAEQETIIVAFRKRTLLALDDCLYALQASIPHLTRSSLHRCLQRHGISRLPDVEGDKPAKRKFAKYAIGYFHLDTEPERFRLNPHHHCMGLMIAINAVLIEALILGFMIIDSDVRRYERKSACVC